jgi:ATP/maltotriose-dependent transcriptional regulator MalT
MRLPAPRIRDLAKRAMQWYEDQGLSDRSVKYLLMTIDSELVLGLTAIDESLPVMDDKAYLAWICSLPPELLISDARLNLLVTWSYVLSGRTEDSRHWLERFLANSKLEASTPMARHVMMKCREMDGEHAQAVEDYRQLLEEHENISPALECIALHALGESYERIGDFRAAQKYYFRTEAVAQLPKSYFFSVFSKYAIARILVLNGEYRRASDECRTMLEKCPVDLTLYGAIFALLAQIQIELFELDTATRSLKQAFLQLSSSLNADMFFEANVVKTRLLLANGRLDDAYRLITQTVLMAQSKRLPRGILQLAYATQSEVSLLCDDIQECEKALDKLRRQTQSDDLLYQLRARLLESQLLLRERNWGAALERAHRVQKLAAPAALGSLVLEAQIRAAVILGTQGQRTSAVRQMNNALITGSAQKIISPFLREGSLVRELVHEIASFRKTSAALRSYAKQILRAFGETRQPASHSLGPDIVTLRLTKREQEIFKLLTSGLSRQEIADTLVLSRNTVKTHLNAIYRKLDIKSRADALNLVSVLDDPPPF